MMIDRGKNGGLRRNCKAGLLTVGLSLGLLFCVSGRTESHPIQLNFLDRPEVLQDTVDRLARAGCGPSALDGFRNLVACQNRLFEPQPTDLTSWGGAALESIETPEQLYGLGAPGFPSLMSWRKFPKRHMLTCFDLALLLLREGPVFAERVSHDFEQNHFRAIQLYSQGGLQRLEVSGSDLQEQLVGSPLLSSLQIYEAQTRLPFRSANESSLALSLRSVRSIPGHYVNTERALSELFEKKVRLWRRDGVVFSDKLRIVQCHYVDLRQKIMGVDHVGLLLAKERGWMYLEKNGSTNPIVRFDFSTIDQLLDYLEMMFEEDRYDPRSPLHLAAFMISINDELPRVLLRSRSEILQVRQE